MKLVCHIGTPKTGSTYLQTSLQDNPVWLAERGILYPDLLSPLANHVTLFYAASQTLDPSARAYGLSDMAAVARFRSVLTDHIRSRIASAPRHVHTMVLSSENLTGNLGHHDVLQLGEMLRPLFDEIRIVVYLRRQDEAVLSMYGEFMRRGYSDQGFEAFIEGALGPNATPPYIQYRRVLEYWIEAFGAEAIRVHLFDRGQMIGGDILQDFLQRCFGPGMADMTGFTPSRQDNRSLSAPAMEALRRLQPWLPFYAGDSVNPARQALEERIDRLPQAPRPRLSRAQSERIMARFNRGNGWVRRTFLPELPAPLFPPRDDLDGTGNVGQLSDRDFAFLVAHLLSDGAVVLPEEPAAA